MPPHAPTDDAPWTIGRLVTWTAGHLTRAGVADARLGTELLLAKAIECRRIDLYTRFDQVPETAALDAFRAFVKRAAMREPIAYIIGEREFFSLPFRVTRDVLIPRPETETLVERALDHCKTRALAAPTILDVGTGSGCIAVALLVQLSEARCVASDVSEAALAITAENASRNGVSERIQLVEADRFHLPAEALPPGGFDILVCNPPYIAAGAIAGLDPEVREYEPRGALTDEGDGLSFYRDMATEAGRLLAPGGAVFVEVADDCAGDVRAVMTTGGWKQTLTVKDRVVGKERVLGFERSGRVDEPPTAGHGAGHPLAYEPVTTPS